MYRPAFCCLLVLALAAATVATAATIAGTGGADRLNGTPQADVIDGRAGNDLLAGLGGNDLLQGGSGRDGLSGGQGDDRIAAHADGERDTVRCGPGLDVVNADLGDAVAQDCEIVSRRLSTDTTESPSAQHATEVEPDSFAWGATVVSAYQVGRLATGGAAAIGFSTSVDAGRTWRSGLLPGVTLFSPLPGHGDRASDPVVAYDVEHGVWLAASLGLSSNAFELLVSRSADGRSWSLPVTAARGEAGDLDKEWVACDNWPASPFRGRCYLSYLETTARRIVTSFSTDGGLTWSAPAQTSSRAPAGLEVNGAQPLPRPDGSLVVVYVTLGGGGAFSRRGTSIGQEVLAARSEDGAATFGREVTVAELRAAPIARLRAPPLPSADVDATGRVYAIWQACRADEGCRVDRLVLSTSADGITWSAPAQVTAAPPRWNQFLPGLAVDPGSSPAATRLAVVYFTLPRDCFDSTSCSGIDAWLAVSMDGGRVFGEPQRLNAESMPVDWLAGTNTGLFLGDYVSTSYSEGRPVPVFTLAAAPVRGRLREAIFALTRPDRTS